MNKRNSIRSKLIFFVILLAFGALAAIVGFGLLGEERATVQSWTGDWEVMYYYEVEPEIPYTAVLTMDMNGEPKGSLAINLPRGARPEIAKFEIQSVNHHPLVISGHIIHESYMIDGGYPKESVELRLDGPKKLSGRGRCVAYCAEGMEESEIIWMGSKLK